MILGSDYIERGNVLAGLGRYEQAIEEYNKVLGSEENHSFACQKISYCYNCLKNFPKATEYANLALKADPNNNYALYLLADIKIRNDLPLEAREFIKKAIEINPDIAYYYCDLARTYLIVDDYKNTIKYAKKGLELDPNETGAFLVLIVAYGKSKQLDKFEEIKTSALSVNPNNRNIHENISWMYNLEKNFEKAKEHSSIALKLYPDSAFAINLHNHNKSKKVIGEKEELTKADKKDIAISLIWLILFIMSLNYWLCN